MTYFEELCADGMFEELGYEKEEFKDEIQYVTDTKIIVFSMGDKAVMCNQCNAYLPELITMKELQAINKKCVELGWLKERD